MTRGPARRAGPFRARARPSPAAGAAHALSMTVRAIPAIRAFVAEMTKESAIGPNGYMKQLGLVAAPNNVRARSQQAARQMSPLNLASLK